MSHMLRERARIKLYLHISIACAVAAPCAPAAPPMGKPSTQSARKSFGGTSIEQKTKTAKNLLPDLPWKVAELPPMPAKIDTAAEPLVLLTWEGSEAPDQIAFAGAFPMNEVAVNATAKTILRITRKNTAIGHEKSDFIIAELSVHDAAITWRWMSRLTDSKADAELWLWLRHGCVTLQRDGNPLGRIQFLKPQEITSNLDARSGRLSCELEGKFLECVPPPQLPTGWDLGEPAKLKFVLLYAQDKKARFDVMFDPSSKTVSTSQRQQLVNARGHINDAELAIRRFQTEKTRVDAKVADLSNRPLSTELTGNSLKDDALRVRIREELQTATQRQAAIPRDIQQQQQNATEWGARKNALAEIESFAAVVRVQASGAILSIVQLQHAPATGSP